MYKQTTNLFDSSNYKFMAIKSFFYEIQSNYNMYKANALCSQSKFNELIVNAKREVYKRSVKNLKKHAC